MKPIRLAIWGSGSGSNAQSIIDYFARNSEVSVSLILSDQSDAYILKRAAQADIPAYYMRESERKSPEWLIGLMSAHEIDLIALAGYMRMVSPVFLQRFQGPVLNIHPALLPAYGGKGLFGHRVHEAVISNKEKASGITIHRVNERYDEGEIIFQQQLIIEPGWSAEKLGEEVLKLEHFWYPRIIEKIAKNLPVNL